MVGVGWSVVVLGLSALLSHAAAQSADTFLNVTVRDSRGRIIRGLEGPDFAVTEDGAPTVVRSVRFVESSKEPIHLALLFDRMSGEPARLSREAALDLLAAAGPNVDFSIWLVDQKLMSLQPSTADRKVLKAAIDAATGKKGPEAPTDNSEVGQSALHGSAQLLRESRYRPSIASLIAIARANQPVAGRKAIVYFSEGVPVPAGEESLLNAIGAANHSAMGVYVVDASGLAISKEEESARAIAMNYRLSTSHQTLNQEDGQGIYGSGRGVTGDRGVAVGNLESRPMYQPSAIAQLAGKTGAFVIGQNGEFRNSMRHLVEDLTAYYVVTYARRSEGLDGRFHEVRATVRREKAKVAAAEGYYAAVEGPGGMPLAFETPLLELLPRAPVRDFPVGVATVQFRGEQPAGPLVALLIEVPGASLQFDEDTAAGLQRAHLSIVAVVRDGTGKIVERFGRDMPIPTPPRRVDEMRRRRFLFQDQTNLAPGVYTLETAVQDRLSGRVNVLKSAFTVTAAAAVPAIEGFSVVRHVVAASDAKSDGAFSLAGKTIVPAVDRVLQGGKGAAATFFFRLYPVEPAPALAFELLRDGKSLVRRPLSAQRGDTAQVVTLDISSMPTGDYDMRILAGQGMAEVSATTRITIENGASPESGTPAPTEAEVEVAPGAPLPSAAPNAGQQRLLEDARTSGLNYAAHLPNFVCTEVTRRLLDPNGKQEWRNLDESAQLVSYYDGKEHYESLTTRNRSAESDHYPPSLTTAGEFGSLLKSIFAAESAAQFAWVRADSLRGNAVQVFSYSVDQAHSQYRVSHQVAGQPKAVFSGFHGLLYVNQETAIVLRLTLESDPLPPDFPVRQMAVSLDYGDIEVGGQVYTLPLSFTVDVRLRKRTQIRNESVFRSYQRFTSSSRIVQQ